MLAIHLFNHEGSAEAAQENRMAHLSEHLRWQPEFARRVVRLAERQGLVERENGFLLLTETGRDVARAQMMG
jgi:manganese/zinc/iron transport system permease protein